MGSGKNLSGITTAFGEEALKFRRQTIRRRLSMFRSPGPFAEVVKAEIGEIQIMEDHDPGHS